MNHTETFNVANKITDLILEVVDLKEEISRGDLQGFAMAQAL